MKPEEVQEIVTSLRNESGEEVKKLRKFWHTENPSIQGTWNPFLNKPPSLRKHIRNKVEWSCNKMRNYYLIKLLLLLSDLWIRFSHRAWTGNFWKATYLVLAVTYRTGFIVVWSSGQNLDCAVHNTFLSIITRVDGFLADVKPSGSKVNIQRLALYWLVVIGSFHSVNVLFVQWILY